MITPSIGNKRREQGGSKHMGGGLFKEEAREEEKEDQRKEYEKQFFDRTFGSEGRNTVSKFYALVKNSRANYKKFILSNCRNKKVLEYGCGKGSSAFSLAKLGAKVVGIDISEVAIKLAKAQAKDVGLADIDFLIMDAEAMQFKDSCFDIACGTGVLHHLQIDKGLKELARVLKPEGKAIFMEPMGYNPAIILFRKLTPHLRTKDEHPLKNKDFKLFKEYFHLTDYRFFHLFSLLAVPFKNTRAFSPFLRMLESLDQKLFEWLPLSKLLAWEVMIILEKPKKAHFR
jgi:ubiquinone/menaquinone biosynthesis C-methylase UbiE